MDTELLMHRLVFFLGTTNFLLAMATVFSCRSCLKILNSFPGHNVMQNRFYSTFYRYHSYYWWGFWGSIVAHVTVGITHAGLPF